MKVKFKNLWKEQIFDFFELDIFSIWWQFDICCSGINITILNFSITIYS